MGRGEQCNQALGPRPPALMPDAGWTAIFSTGQDVDEQWRVQIADWRHQLGISSKYNLFDRLKLKIKGLRLTAKV